MSHIVGTVQFPASVVIGPDSGDGPSSPNIWTHSFVPADPPIGTVKMVLLHFEGVSLPANNRLEVDLGYGTDVFTSADGGEFWTRPINVGGLGGSVAIRYITDGAGTGGATLDRYARGERHSGDQDPSALSNCDPFLRDGAYTEPKYDPFWFCHTPPHWENAACVTMAGDIRKTLTASIGMVVHVGETEIIKPAFPIMETCTVTLIGPDTVITAGHCMGEVGAAAPDPEALASASVCFGYETTCAGGKPGSYDVRFHKVIKSLAYRRDSGGDYCILQLRVPAGGLGLPQVTMRADLPPPGEPMFGLHHPNGAVMKLSPLHPGFGNVIASDPGGINISLDVSGGSSGSGLFDQMGRITGVLSAGSACNLFYFPTATILQQLATPSVPAVANDVMMVIDRSGSMSEAAGTGRTKMEEAQDAASLFVQLIRTGGGNRLGMVSFSSAASMPVDFAIANVTAANKTTLIGPSPFSGGKVGGLSAGGTTSIGDGLDKARLQFPAPGPNPRTILLMTDGMQNTSPMISDIGGLGGIAINAIGFGEEGTLDGPLLTQLSEDHDGLYVRAGDGLDLKKYFALAFGNIFEAGALLDPEFVIRANEPGPKVPFDVCGEEAITIVAGWDRADATLIAEVTTPGGAVINPLSPGVESSTGLTWTFMRIPLPHGGERDGHWSVQLVRPSGGGEFPPPRPLVRSFVNVVARGGPVLKRMPDRKRYFTGDRINPLVQFAYATGGAPDNAKLTVTVRRPAQAAGAVLSAAGLGPAKVVGGDTIPARQATLMGLPAIGHTDHGYELSNLPKDNRQFEAGGMYGRWIDDLLTVEGTYTFHVVATYGEGCVSSRELQWSMHVEPAIDPGRTTVGVIQVAPRPDGTLTGILVITPRDPYGNPIGPGRGGDLTVTGAPGTTITGPVLDNGDGSYNVPVGWGPDGRPGVVISQPGRPPVVITPGPAMPVAPGGLGRCRYCWILVLLLILALLVALWLLVMK